MCIHTEEPFSHVRSLSFFFSLSLSRSLFLSLSDSLSCSFSVSLSLSLPPPPRTHVTTRHHHGVHTAQMRLVRTINCARYPRPACGMGSGRSVDMFYIHEHTHTQKYIRTHTFTPSQTQSATHRGGVATQVVCCKGCLQCVGCVAVRGVCCNVL